MAKLKATPKNFTQAQQLLGTKSSIRLGNNTFLERVWERVYEEGRIPEERATICVRLHNTNIVTFHDNNTTTVQSGGYRTTTTKERINQFVNGRLYQKAGEWFYTTAQGSTFEFFDGQVCV